MKTSSRVGPRLPYFVSLASCSILASCLSFTSAQADDAANWPNIPGKGVTVFAAGDIAECKKLPASASAATKTASIIQKGLAADPSGQVLTLGDNSYPIGVPQEFIDCYEPTWGQFKSVTHPSSGNHEYYTPQANGYYNYFGDAAGAAPGFYYSFNIGQWHLLSLNSNIKGKAWEDELAWVKSDLAKSNAHCTLAYWHHPRFSSGGHGNNDDMQPLWALLETAHADVVLNGHDHDYERFAPQDQAGRKDDLHGMREFVVGTGGAKLTPLLFRKSNSEFVDNGTHGVLKLTLKDTGYEWEFLAEPGKLLTDRGAGLCHQAQHPK
ncbi:MAG TPA: metallophosphoesterase [Burkholderiaceae bacterium]